MFELRALSEMSTFAMHVAKTGLNSQQIKMQVIANNLANVNTTGFKQIGLTLSLSFTKFCVALEIIHQKIPRLHLACRWVQVRAFSTLVNCILKAA